MSDEKGGLKEWAVLIPIAGSSIAVTYDVGYFWGLDIKSFTLFTLSEHVVFALEAIPIALLVGCYLLLGEVLSVWLDKRAAARSQANLKRMQAWRGVEQGKKWLLIYEIAVRVVALGLVAFIGHWAFSKGYFAIGVAIIYLTLNGLSITTKTNPLGRSPIRFTYMATGGLLLSFALGNQAQARDVARTRGSHVLVLTDRELRGVLVRAGERGVLFLEKDRSGYHDQPQLVFFKWEEVKNIKRQEAVSGAGRYATILFEHHYRHCLARSVRQCELGRHQVGLSDRNGEDVSIERRIGHMAIRWEYIGASRCETGER